VASYVEGETGKRSDRPELAKALCAARKAKATLLIAKLDRLGRNVAFIANLIDAGVEFLACDQPFASRLTLHILPAVAEDEARRISERAKAALQAAKARGRKLGSPIAAKTVAIARAARSAYAARAPCNRCSLAARRRRAFVRPQSRLLHLSAPHGRHRPRSSRLICVAIVLPGAFSRLGDQSVQASCSWPPCPVGRSGMWGAKLRFRLGDGPMGWKGHR
jgi:hypothetical protein